MLLQHMHRIAEIFRWKIAIILRNITAIIIIVDCTEQRC